MTDAEYLKKLDDLRYDLKKIKGTASSYTRIIIDQLIVLLYEKARK